jgi:hypothetical protein
LKSLKFSGAGFDFVYSLCVLVSRVELLARMALLTPKVIVEWLKRRGAYELSSTERKRTFSRGGKNNVFPLLLLALVVGVGLGWLLQKFW